TPTSPAAGEIVGVDAQHAYVDVEFVPVAGRTVDASSASLTLTGPSAVTVAAAGTRVGASNTFRFAVSGALAVGAYGLTLAAGSFLSGEVLVTVGGWHDGAGNVAQAETERFTVETPSSALADPAATNGRDVLNGRHTIDVTYTPVTGRTVNAATVTGNELTLSGAAAAGVTVT